MKIAVVHNLPPGGQKRLLNEQVRLLLPHHEINIYSPLSEKFIYPPSFPKNIISIYTSLKKANLKIADKINRLNYDIAYVHPCFLTQAPYVLRYLKIPSLYYCPEPKREFYESIPRISNKLSYMATFPFRYPIKWIDQNNTKSATRVITNSFYSKSRIDKIYGISTFVNYPGVDKVKFKKRKVKKKNMVMTVGDLSLLKGHDFIIKSISLIDKKIRPKLLLIGYAGVDADYFLSFAKTMQVDLEIRESVSDSELIRYYNEAKVFLFAGKQEPFGMVLLEAASCGTPILAVKSGGVSEILDTVSSSATLDRDEEKFARALSDLLVQKLNRNNLKKDWSWEKSVNELEKNLKEISL